MSRRLLEQFVTFYFAIGDQPMSAYSEDASSFSIWKKAIAKITELEKTHPLATFKEVDDPYGITHQNWELCNQNAEVKELQNVVGWPVEFYREKSFDAKSLEALRDLCLDCFKAAGQACSPTVQIRFLEASCQSIYTEIVTEKVPGL